ncbi:MAG: thiolase family protein [Syntrophomonadaceae bacterium]|nr:thiolase family protein [Syntrophomonadaceae bacterium]
MKEVVIVSGARTPVGDFQGSLQGFNPIDLGVFALNGALERAGLEANQLDEVIAGHCNQSSSPGNSARHVALRAGCRDDSFACTVHQQCPSSMRAAEILSQEIMLGKIDMGAAVGIESMTNTPYLLFGARKGYRLGNGEQIVDGLMKGGLICEFVGYHMGVTAENIAEMYGITREEQDAYALLSHQRACQAIKEGWFKDEIVPVEVQSRKGSFMFDTDEHPRSDTSLESLARLKPAFKKGGTVTAANASGLNDGGSALIMMSADKAKELGVKPIARVVSSASGAVEPRIMGMGVVPAVRRALKFAGLEQNDIDYWEINEAFAAQFLGVNRELKIDLEKVNGVGSGIAIGHPVGATGARLIVTMINEMKRRGVRYGCASLCASGGPGVAFIVESI